MTATIATNVRDGPTTTATGVASTAASIAAAATSAASGTGRATRSPRGSAMTRPSAAGVRTSAAMSAWVHRSRRSRLIATVGRDYGRDRSFFGGGRSDRDFNYDRGVFNRGGSSERDYGIAAGGTISASGSPANRGRDRGYRPMTGDYGRGGP